jgi:cobalt-zinc-cadmium efflux system outer membrane protein
MGLTIYPAAFADVETTTLSLSDAQKLFYEFNKELLAAKRAVQAAEADKITAAQKPNPLVSLGVSNLNLNRSEGNKNSLKSNSNSIQNQTLDSTVQVSQLYERGNKRELRIAAAHQALTASKFDLKDTERQLIRDLNNAYYDLLLAQEAENVQITNLNLYERTLKASELRLKAGDVPSSDVARIRVDLLKSKNDLRQAQANREKAQAALAYMLGQEANSSKFLAADNWPNLEHVNTQDFFDKLTSRPDLLAADARTRQAEENQKLANSLKTRDIDIALQYQRFPGQTPGVGENTIGASVTFPLFTNYEYQGEIARSEVDYYTAVDSKEQIKAAAISEIRNAASDLQSSIEKVDRYDQQILKEAKQAADAAEFAYKHGASSITDLLDSMRVLRAIQLDAASARADYAKALAAWQAAVKTESSPQSQP